LLILDEPTNTLDPTMRDELLAQLREAGRQGQAVLFSSHVLTEVEQVCDRVGILQRGRLVHVQRMSDLRAARLIRARFHQPPPALPDLEGLHVRDQRDGRVVWEYGGDLPPLLDWLARQPLADLRVEPLGLSAIYHRYHGVEG
jgi:ABC-2 type transport system ATP-binding protein